MSANFDELRVLLRRVMRFYLTAAPEAIYVDFHAGVFRVRDNGEWFRIENEVQMRRFFMHVLKGRDTPASRRQAMEHQIVIDQIENAALVLNQLHEQLQEHQRVQLPQPERFS